MSKRPRPKITREISGMDGLEEWLSSNSNLDPVIAARIALRILPLMYGPKDHPSDELTLTLLLQGFRAALIIWAGRSYGGNSTPRTARLAADAVDYARAAIPKNAKESPVADAAAYTVARITRTFSKSTREGIDSRPVVSIGIDGAEYALERVANRDGIEAFCNSPLVDANWTKLSDPKRIVSSRPGLIDEPLWIEDVRGSRNFRVNLPVWARDPWSSLKRSRTAKEAGFDIWTQWYESLLSGRKEGRFDRTLKGGAERRIVARVVSLPNEFWERNAAIVNAEIKTWIEEAKKSAQSVSPPQVPKTRPAAIEPLWEDGKLTLPNILLSSDLDESSLLAALDALREDLAELAADVLAVQNIDHRPAEYLRRLADRIPDTMPSQTLLFRLGHANEVLNDLARTTDVEWPDLLAARYRRLALQYERAVRQFPKWRAFVRNAAEQKFTTEQIAVVPQIAETVVTELQTDDAREFVDPAIPDALQTTQVPIVDWEKVTSSGNERLAEDVLESINNVLKRTIELSLALKSAGIDPLASWTGKTTKKAAEEFGKEAKKSIVKEFGKLGKATGPALGRFLKRIAKVTTLGGATIGGSSLLLRQLFTLYPDTFGWLEPVLRFLHLL